MDFSRHNPSRRSGPLRALRAAEAGAISAEYLMVVATVGITLAITLTALAPATVMSWSYARHVLYGGAP